MLCQTADIFLPVPTPFKAWLHDKMGFGDSVGVLFQKEVYEADLSAGSYSIQEAESPFALVNNAVKASTGKELSSETYRQVSYVNDISFSNEQVLMEKAVNGSLGESVTGYSYGLWRESYRVNGTGISAVPSSGIGMGTGSGTYYYTGTGSLGLQYLRARYLKVETGTFTSRDTYVGRVRDIISQNRYTYAGNNPVTFADPSGHKKIGAVIGSIVNTVKNTVSSTTSGNNSRGSGSSGGISTLLDNIRIYNGIDYYNNILL